MPENVTLNHRLRMFSRGLVFRNGQGPSRIMFLYGLFALILTQIQQFAAGLAEQDLARLELQQLLWSLCHITTGTG